MARRGVRRFGVATSDDGVINGAVDKTLKLILHAGERWTPPVLHLDPVAAPAAPVGTIPVLQTMPSSLGAARSTTLPAGAW
jgi:hypothetical protein